MSGALLAGVVGLALLDSLNPVSIITTALIFLITPRRPALTAMATILGAFLAIFALGAVLFVTAGAAAGAVEGIMVALQFFAFGIAGAGLAFLGLRRLKARERQPVALPAWFRPSTAVPFGFVITAADAPTAFPYFIAIERMVSAEVSLGPGLAAVGLYTLIYCIPCGVGLVVGLVSRRRAHALLERVQQRFGSGVVKRSLPAAGALVSAGLVAGSAPLWLLPSL